MKSGRPFRALRSVPGTDRWASRPLCDRTSVTAPTGEHPAHTTKLAGPVLVAPGMWTKRHTLMSVPGTDNSVTLLIALEAFAARAVDF
jgi:hypothetical protein